MSSQWYGFVAMQMSPVYVYGKFMRNRRRMLSKMDASWRKFRDAMSSTPVSGTSSFCIGKLSIPGNDFNVMMRSRDTDSGQSSSSMYTA